MTSRDSRATAAAIALAFYPVAATAALLVLAAWLLLKGFRGVATPRSQ